MTQPEMVKKYIEDFGSITPLQALADLGVYRLSACIFKLRKSGVAIITETEKSINRYGKPMKYGRYKFAEGVNE